MTISEIGTVFGISLAVAGGIGTSVKKLWLDDLYVGSEQLMQMECRTLFRERQALEFKSERSEVDELRLQNIIRDMQNLGCRSA